MKLTLIDKQELNGMYKFKQCIIFVFLLQYIPRRQRVYTVSYGFINSDPFFNFKVVLLLFK